MSTVSRIKNGDLCVQTHINFCVVRAQTRSQSEIASNIYAFFKVEHYDFSEIESSHQGTFSILSANE